MHATGDTHLSSLQSGVLDEEWETMELFMQNFPFILLIAFRPKYSSQHFVLKDTRTANSHPRVRCWGNPSRLHPETVYAFLNRRHSYREQCFERPVSEISTDFWVANELCSSVDKHSVHGGRSGLDPRQGSFPANKAEEEWSCPLLNLVGHHGLVLRHRGHYICLIVP
jgi:hypothetical protein